MKMTQNIIQLVGNSLEIKPNFFFLYSKALTNIALTFHYLQNIRGYEGCVLGR